MTPQTFSKEKINKVFFEVFSISKNNRLKASYKDAFGIVRLWKMIFRIRNHFYRTAQYQPIIYRLNKEQTEEIGLFRIPNKYISVPLFRDSNKVNEQQLKVLFLLVVADYKRLGRKIKFSDIRPSYIRSRKTHIKASERIYFKIPNGLFKDIKKTSYIHRINPKIQKREWLKNPFLPNKIKLFVA